MKNRVIIKAEARELLRTGRVSPIAVGAIALVLSNTLSMLSSLFDKSSLTMEDLLLALESGDIYALYENMPPLSPVGTFVSILSTLVITVFSAGCASYGMSIRRSQFTPISTLLDGVGIAGRVIWCDILMKFKIFLWSMFFVIPGIIAAYRYRFAMYNLISDPELSASQAIALSCKQTQGMKMDLFILDLSFLGWELLNAFTMGLLGIWTMPYILLSDLGYYEEAQKRMGSTASGDEEKNNETPWEF